MKRSIRTRLTLVFAGLTAFIIISIWAVNNWCLESYYLIDKINVLQKAYTKIDQIIIEEKGLLNGIINETEDEYSNISSVIRELREKYNIALVIYDSDNDKILVSSTRDIDLLTEKVRRYKVGLEVSEQQILEEHENYIIQKTYDYQTKSLYLESWGFFSDDSTTFIMSVPLASIRDSVKLSNRFLFYVGLIVIFISSIIMYLTSRHVTAPIQKLSELSEKMSHLDFEAKYVDTKGSMEEISTLGNSMNLLSDRLKEAIGDLKRANLELQKDIEEKIKVDEMRKDFIANVSHELKTPIALIQGYAEGLAEGMAENQESRDYYCEVIVDEANKMNKMVKQLLTLTALEFGSADMTVEQFELTDLIQGILSSAKFLIEQKGASVEFRNTGPVFVWADEFKIEEVIINYLNNALNHVEGEKKIVISTEINNKTVMVSVFNTGAPIPEEDIPNLWNKFFKVDKAHTREYGGSGIGLSIVKAIMESHHREYGVRNYDNGVEFWFTLDCSNEIS